MFGAKFCMVISSRPNFIMPVQYFGGLTPKNFMVQKHAKFGPRMFYRIELGVYVTVEAGGVSPG